MASSEPLVCPRPPTEKPEFTIGTLRKAIPAHCFKRSLWRSFSYLIGEPLGNPRSSADPAAAVAGGSDSPMCFCCLTPRCTFVLCS
jgi:hypothetical protein